MNIRNTVLALFAIPAVIFPLAVYHTNLPKPVVLGPEPAPTSKTQEATPVFFNHPEMFVVGQTRLNARKTPSRVNPRCSWVQLELTGRTVRVCDVPRTLTGKISLMRRASGQLVTL